MEVEPLERLHKTLSNNIHEIEIVEEEIKVLKDQEKMLTKTAEHNQEIISSFKCNSLQVENELMKKSLQDFEEQNEFLRTECEKNMTKLELLTAKLLSITLYTNEVNTNYSILSRQLDSTFTSIYEQHGLCKEECCSLYSLNIAPKKNSEKLEYLRRLASTTRNRLVQSEMFLRAVEQK